MRERGSDGDHPQGVAVVGSQSDFPVEKKRLTSSPLKWGLLAHKDILSASERGSLCLINFRN